MRRSFASIGSERIVSRSTGCGPGEWMLFQADVTLAEALEFIETVNVLQPLN